MKRRTAKSKVRYSHDCSEKRGADPDRSQILTDSGKHIVTEKCTGVFWEHGHQYNADYRIRITVDENGQFDPSETTVDIFYGYCPKSSKHGHLVSRGGKIVYWRQYDAKRGTDSKHSDKRIGLADMIRKKVIVFNATKFYSLV